MKRIIFLFITLLINIFLILYIYNGPLVYKRFYKVINDNNYMLMGLGKINNDIHTNSIDALEFNKDENIFEVDLALTSDKKLVLADGWNLTDYKKNIGIKYYNDLKESVLDTVTPDYKTFMDFKIQYKYTASDFDDLVKFMKKNKDVYVCLDLGFSEPKALEDMLKIIVKKSNKDLLNRFIIYIYNDEMLNVTSKYNDINEFIDYCKTNNINIISSTLSGINKEKVDLLHDNKFIVIVNDISNENEAKMLLSWNVDLIGSYNLK